MIQNRTPINFLKHIFSADIAALATLVVAEAEDNYDCILRSLRDVRDKVDEWTWQLQKERDEKMEQPEECQHRGTMTLTPTETRGWEIMDWCFYLGKRIKEECPSDCPYKDKEVDYE